MQRFPLIVVGASAGGVAALQLLASALPSTLAAAVLVVLHVGAHRSELPALLNSAGRLPAKHPLDGERILPGHIYIAPPDRHMIVEGDHLRLFRGPKENWARPAIDPLFRSAAAAYGTDVLGLVLTGRLNDGTLGLFEVKRHGGIAVAQDPDDAAYPEMPRSALDHVALDYCLPLAEIPELLIALVDGKDGRETAMPKTPSHEQAAESSDVTETQSFDRPIAITCPDCGGALDRSDVGTIVKFSCHIGHTYTAEIMAKAQSEEMERVMRAAVRFLNERAEFCRQMAEHTRLAEPDLSDDWNAASGQALDRAYKLRDLVEQDWLTPRATETRRLLA